LLLRALATAKDHESAILPRESCEECRRFVTRPIKRVDKVPLAKPKLPFDARSPDTHTREAEATKIALGKHDFVV
jgi:hypothetical protein